MSRGTIRYIKIRYAWQHGLGLYDVGGYIHHCEVTKVSDESPDDFDGVFLSDAGGSIVEDNQIPAQFARYGINWSGVSNVSVGGNKVGGPLTRDYNHGTDTIWTRSSSESMSKGGVLVVGAGTFKLPISYQSKLISIRAAVGTAPTGAAIICDVNKNGTSIFPTTTKPTIAVSTFLSQIAIPDTYEVTNGDYLTVDIDQIGSTIAGTDLTVRVMMENEG